MRVRVRLASAPQMRGGDRVERGGNICLQQQESSKRGFRRRLFLDGESSEQQGAADRRAGYLQFARMGARCCANTCN